MGVTTGGAQDIGLARNAVAAGRIPEPSAFVIEGLLGEHDIDIAHAPCDQLLCFDASVGVAPALDSGVDTAFMVVGFSSAMERRALQRPALNLALVIDHSGSMSGAKMAAAREAAHRIIDQLGPDDRLTLIVFDDDVDVLADGQPVDARTLERLHRRVSGIRDDGGTDLEGALALAYERLARHRDDGREDRVLMVTDARPTVGRTGESDFVRLAAEYAEAGFGLTVVGVGLDFGQDLSLAMSRVPGANYVYIETAAKLEERLGRDFDMLVTPLAWDFEMRVEPIPGYRVSRAFGVPSWVADEGDGAVVVHIPTLFPSNNRGAIVLALEPQETVTFAPGPIAHRALRYRERRGGDLATWEGEVVVPEVLVGDDPGVAKAVALVNTGLGLQGAAALAHEGRYVEALAVLDAVRALVGDAEYDAEQRLVAQLTAVIEDHARAAGDRYERDEVGRVEGDARWIR
ncbi:MAG: VWA domain-containing protein [Deltaproteobacteria bacterium]|nr:MAG: VWA domain-containing protein [Deltaproteobacteria bacterium]